MMKKLFITRDLTSFVNRGAKVIPQVTQAAPVTLSLVFGAAVIWVVVSIGMGVARRASSAARPIDAAVMIIGLIGISMPVFWLGEVVNLLTQSRFHDTFLFSWVPPLGYMPFTQSPCGWFKALLLPWLTLSMLYIGIYARVLRSALVEAQEEDYVRTARAKGLTERRVLLRHALRTSLVAFVSPLRARLRRARRRRRAAHRGRLRPARRRQADLRLAAEPRPAGDHGDRHVRRVLRRRSRTRSSISSTPGSTRGCGMPDATPCSRCATSRLVPHRGRRRARGRRALALARARRGASGSSASPAPARPSR